MSSASVQFSIGGLVCGALLLFAASCATPPSPIIAPDSCFLATTEETVYSEILQGRQRIVMTFELVDGVPPHNAAKIDGNPGHWIPPGLHRLQFRVFLRPVGWNNGRGREARAVVDLDLLPGCHYRVVGDCTKSIKTFYVSEIDSGKFVTPPIDIGFFAPIESPKGVVPIFIPIVR